MVPLEAPVALQVSECIELLDILASLDRACLRGHDCVRLLGPAELGVFHVAIHGTSLSLADLFLDATWAKPFLP